jgi:hypothetical protein
MTERHLHVVLGKANAVGEVGPTRILVHQGIQVRMQKADQARMVAVTRGDSTALTRGLREGGPRDEKRSSQPQSREMAVFQTVVCFQVVAPTLKDTRLRLYATGDGGAIRGRLSARLMRTVEGVLA